MSNSDTAQFDLSQHGSWYLLAGIEVYLESVDSCIACDTLLLELARLEAWEAAHGGYYTGDRFDELRQRILERSEDIAIWDAQCDAELRREQFTVIDGGKKSA